jgi:tRNA (Thr-GGU) A37 N-methylase
MKAKAIRYRPIGVIHSPFKEVRGMPIQPLGAKGVKGYIEMDPAVAVGPEDLDGFSHLILLYHYHRMEASASNLQPPTSPQKAERVSSKTLN